MQTGCEDGRSRITVINGDESLTSITFLWNKLISYPLDKLTEHFAKSKRVVTVCSFQWVKKSDSLATLRVCSGRKKLCNHFPFKSLKLYILTENINYRSTATGCWVINTSASHSWGTRFETQPRGYPAWRFLLISSVPPRKFWFSTWK